MIQYKLIGIAMGFTGAFALACFIKCRKKTTVDVQSLTQCILNKYRTDAIIDATGWDGAVENIAHDLLSTDEPGWILWLLRRTSDIPAQVFNEVAVLLEDAFDDEQELELKEIELNSAGSPIRTYDEI